MSARLGGQNRYCGLRDDWFHELTDRNIDWSLHQLSTTGSYPRRGLLGRPVAQGRASLWLL